MFQIAKMEQLITDARGKQRQLVDIFKTVDQAQQRLTISFNKAQSEIEESARNLIQLVDEHRRQLLKELENGYSAKQVRAPSCRSAQNDAFLLIRRK